MNRKEEPSPSISYLKRSAVAGVKQLGIAQVGQNLIGIATTAILASLLKPNDFGVMAMAMVVISFVSLFSELGISAAIIHRQELTNNLLSSTFWLQIIFGILAVFIVVLSVEHVAIFFGEPRLSKLLLVLAGIFIISSLSAMQRALLEREFKFDRIALAGIISVIAGSIFGISAAIIGLGVWSLVIQVMVTASVNSTVLWYFSEWRPAFVFKISEVRKIARFSTNLLGSSILIYIVRNIDDLLIGKYLGSDALGFYSLAYRIMLFPLQQISQLIIRVLFPVLSRLQQDNEKFRAAYLKVIFAIGCVAFPIMGGFWLSAEPIVGLIFGEEWHPVVVLLLILVPAGAVQSIMVPTGYIYMAKGRTDLQFRMQLVRTVLTVPAFVIGLNWGIEGVAVAFVSALVIMVPPAVFISFRLIELRIRDWLASLIPPALASLIMIGALELSQAQLTWDIASITDLIALTVVGALIYACAILLLDYRRISELVHLVRSG